MVNLKFPNGYSISAIITPAISFGENLESGILVKCHKKKTPPLQGRELWAQSSLEEPRNDGKYVVYVVSSLFLAGSQAAAQLIVRFYLYHKVKYLSSFQSSHFQHSPTMLALGSSGFPHNSLNVAGSPLGLLGRCRGNRRQVWQRMSVVLTLGTRTGSPHATQKTNSITSLSSRPQ